MRNSPEIIPKTLLIIALANIKLITPVKMDMVSFIGNRIIFKALFGFVILYSPFRFRYLFYLIICLYYTMRGRYLSTFLHKIIVNFSKIILRSVIFMATTRIMTVHPNQEWGAAQTVKDVIDYVINPVKTNDGLFVSAFECDLDIVADDFMSSRDEYLFNTGRNQGEHEILVYHVRQSFVPGEITDADMVNKLGYELALELTGGNHSFVVCTHTDRPHLHNHIIINAVNLDCDRKFRNGFLSYKRVQEIADRISAENNLHVVENPNLSKGTKNR